MKVDHPFVKTRSLASASKASRSKARLVTEAQLPYKPRPATSAVVAQRMIFRGLGLTVKTPHEVREAERQMLKEAKGKNSILIDNNM